MTEDLESRYDGKPLVRLLDCYVLHAIGHLEDSQARKLGEMCPELQKAFSVRGSWTEVLEQVMSFPPAMPSLIKEMWERNQTLAKSAGQRLSPEDFARMFVDSNFPTGEEEAIQQPQQQRP